LLERAAVAALLAEQQRDERRPLVARHALLDGDGPDPVARERGREERERHVVRQVQAKAGIIEEQEVADEAEFDALLALRDAAGHEAQLVQRLLHRRVLQRVEPERLRRRVQRREQRHALRLERAAALDERSRRRAHDAGASRRNARATALRTTVSGSCAARSSAARAGGALMRPSARAAHARSSADARRRRKPRPLRMLSSRWTLSTPPSVP